METELAPAVAAQREHDHLGRVADRIREHLAHERVDAVGVSRDRSAAALPAHRVVAQLLPSGVEPLPR